MPTRLSATPHPAPKYAANYVAKLHLRLLQMGTWRYLRYLHLRDSLLTIIDGIETVGVVGAGHGIAELALAIEFPHIHFTLTDARMGNYPIYDGAQDIAWQWGIDNVGFGVWNILQPTPRRFDLVASTEVLEHIEDADTAARRIREAASKYVYCLVPHANASENADPNHRKFVWDTHEHFVAGYDADQLTALFPDPLHIKGAYFADAGRILRDRLSALDAAGVASGVDALLALAETDLKPDIPTTRFTAAGIRILSHAGDI